MSLPSVVPVPVAIEATGEAPFALAADTALSGPPDAVATARALIETHTGVRLAPGGDAPGVALRIAGGTPESYTLEVSARGVTVTGADAAGLFYGIQTLGQLIVPAPGGGRIPAVRIEDAPRFGYRGVMLDVARHFLDVATVQAYIDRAASLKCNHLHLHLTDDQGWRLQSLTRPLLTERASSTSIGDDPGGFYTREDYRGIVAYAAARHIVVVPEIDLPGHTHAVSLAYPELCEPPVLTAHVLETVHAFGGGAPETGRPYRGLAVGFSSLRIHDEATYAFVSDVLGELAALTPGPFLHIGGDEALGTARADYDLFVGRVSRIAADLGKTPIAWHEAGGSADLAAETVGQYWGFVSPTDGMDEKARAFVRHGAGVILSPADAVYLDMKFDAASPLGLTWANGVTTARRAYAWDPAEVVEGVDEDRILGVEAPLWTETVRTLADIDALAFPRIAAAAEIAWSPAPACHALRTWESFARRTGALGPFWTRQGVRFTRLAEIPWDDDDDAAGAAASSPTDASRATDAPSRAVPEGGSS